MYCKVLSTFELVLDHKVGGGIILSTIEKIGGRIMENGKEKKKVIIISSMSIVALLLIVGISYAFWQTTKIQEDTNIVASGCFGVELEGNNPISLSNSYPIPSEAGMETTPYTFTITNTCEGEATYNVNLEALANTTFQNDSIRVALDDSNKLYSEYSVTEKYYETSKEARTLISGTLESKGSVTYNLRIWIDEEAPNTEQNKVFASKIVITTGEGGEIIYPSIKDLEVISTVDTIKITYNANGNVEPAICKWGIEEGIYDNEVSEATASNCNITGLTSNTLYYYQICTETNKGSKCIDGSIKTKVTPDIENINEVKIGDYISMTPTATSYTISSDLTGYTDTQYTDTINPSELNLWRVIRKNEDGTIDVVSEYISSGDVGIYGSTGYMNYIGVLNMLAAQYTNPKYVQSTRHMGYSNQIEYCTSIDIQECPGDEGNSMDMNLVQTALGTLVGTDLDGVQAAYWLSTRNIGGSSGRVRYGTVILKDGTLGPAVALFIDGIGHVGAARIRPILTLKKDINIMTGNGQSAETAYSFE